MTHGPSFTEMQEHLFDLYLSGQYADALSVANDAAARFPDMVGRTSYFRACMLSLLGQPEEAVEALSSGLQHGAWWAPQMLEGDPDLEQARKLPQMSDIIRESARRHASAQAQSKAEVFLSQPAYSEQLPPLLLAMHWRSGSGQEFLERFRPAALEHGFCVASLQSSQMCAAGEFCWDDQTIAEADVAKVCQQLLSDSNCRFDPDQVVFAGASQGGRMAISMALTGTHIPARGFIAVVPAIRDLSSFRPYIESAAHRGVRGYIITGERDQFLKATCQLHDELAMGGILCGLEIVPKMPHTFPQDFSERLARAIRFVMDD